jgi:hypothetical protein
MPTLQQLLERYKGKAHIHLVSPVCCGTGPFAARCGSCATTERAKLHALLYIGSAC